MTKNEAFKRWRVREPFVNLHCLLGEGPYYEKTTHSLRFVDIRKQQLHTVPLHTPELAHTIQLDEPVSVTADVEGINPTHKILVALKYGLAILDRSVGRYEYTHRFPRNESMRSNDGAVDPSGQFWVGTMSDFGIWPLQPLGALYRMNHTTTQKILGGLTIPNAVGWSPNHTTMYFTNTTARQILAFEYSAQDSEISNQRVLYQHTGPGEPDGFRVDVEGNLWQAIYGEGRVVKISPDGQIIGEVLLPTRNVTCTQFVGTQLFVTSGEDTDGDGESRNYGGGLFCVDVGVEGLQPFCFQMARQEDATTVDGA